MENNSAGPGSGGQPGYGFPAQNVMLANFLPSGLSHMSTLSPSSHPVYASSPRGIPVPRFDVQASAAYLRDDATMLQDFNQYHHYVGLRPHGMSPAQGAAYINPPALNRSQSVDAIHHAQAHGAGNPSGLYMYTPSPSLPSPAARLVDSEHQFIPEQNIKPPSGTANNPNLLPSFSSLYGSASGTPDFHTISPNTSKQVQRNQPSPLGNQSPIFHQPSNTHSPTFHNQSPSSSTIVSMPSEQSLFPPSTTSKSSMHQNFPYYLSGAGLHQTAMSPNSLSHVNVYSASLLGTPRNNIEPDQSQLEELSHNLSPSQQHPDAKPNLCPIPGLPPSVSPRHDTTCMQTVDRCIPDPGQSKSEAHTQSDVKPDVTNLASYHMSKLPIATDKQHKGQHTSSDLETSTISDVMDASGSSTEDEQADFNDLNGTSSPPVNNGHMFPKVVDNHLSSDCKVNDSSGACQNEAITEYVNRLTSLTALPSTSHIHESQPSSAKQEISEHIKQSEMLTSTPKAIKIENTLVPANVPFFVLGRTETDRRHSQRSVDKLVVSGTPITRTDTDSDDDEDEIEELQKEVQNDEDDTDESRHSTEDDLNNYTYEWERLKKLMSMHIGMNAGKDGNQWQPNPFAEAALSGQMPAEGPEHLHNQQLILDRILSSSALQQNVANVAQNQKVRAQPITKIPVVDPDDKRCSRAVMRTLTGDSATYITISYASQKQPGIAEGADVCVTASDASKESACNNQVVVSKYFGDKNSLTNDSAVSFSDPQNESMNSESCGSIPFNSSINIRIDDSQLVAFGDFKRWQCHLCEKSYTTKNNLVTHILGHQGIKPHSCLMCGKSFKQLSHLNTHMLTHDNIKPHICQVCGKGFTQISHLKRHHSIHLTDNPHVCDICNRGFTFPSELKVHKDRVHFKHTPILHPDGTITTAEDIPCEYCDKKFRYPSQLKDHMTSHSGYRPHMCGECGQEFIKEHHLRAHQFTHTGLKPYKCDICGRSFNQKANMMRHTLIHNAERLYKCDKCERTFTQPQTLKSHMVVHADRKPYSCKLCGKEFGRLHNLHGHMHMHDNSKPYVCFCGSSFTLKEFGRNPTIRERIQMYMAYKSNNGVTDIPEATGNLNRHKKVKHGITISDSTENMEEDAVKLLHSLSERVIQEINNQESSPAVCEEFDDVEGTSRDEDDGENMSTRKQRKSMPRKFMPRKNVTDPDMSLDETGKVNMTEEGEMNTWIKQEQEDVGDYESTNQSDSISNPYDEQNNGDRGIGDFTGLKRGRSEELDISDSEAEASLKEDEYDEEDDLTDRDWKPHTKRQRLPDGKGEKLAAILEQKFSNE